MDAGELDDIIIKNYGLLKKYAIKYAYGDDDLMYELISYGVAAIHRAVKSFNAEKGYKWSTYVGMCIVNAYKTYFREKYVKYDFDEYDDKVHILRQDIDYTDEYLKDKIHDYLSTCDVCRVESLLAMYTTHETIQDVADRRKVKYRDIRNEAIDMLDELKGVVNAN